MRRRTRSRTPRKRSRASRPPATRPRSTTRAAICAPRSTTSARRRTTTGTTRSPTSSGAASATASTTDRPSAARRRIAPVSAPGGTGGISDTRAVFRAVLMVLAVVITLWLLYLLRKPLGWMVIAAFIAIAVSGPINLLSRHMKRGFAIAIVYVCVVLTPFAMLAVLVPPIVEQGQNLADNAPKYAQDVQDYVNKNENLQDLNEKYDLTSKLTEQANKLPSKLGSAAGTLADVGASLVSGIFAGVTILFLSIFMASAAPRWRAAFLRLHPPHRADLLDRMFDRIANAVGNYVRGALLQALIAGVSSYIVLRILGVPYPLALALIIFALDLVPLVGATIGAVAVGLV